MYKLKEPVLEVEKGSCVELTNEDDSSRAMSLTSATCCRCNCGKIWIWDPLKWASLNFWSCPSIRTKIGFGGCT